MTHTLAHALNPQQCDCNPRDITSCVICGKNLHGSPHLAPHLDTCGERCFKQLLHHQRSIRVITATLEVLREAIATAREECDD